MAYSEKLIEHYENPRNVGTSNGIVHTVGQVLRPIDL